METATYDEAETSIYHIHFVVTHQVIRLVGGVLELPTGVQIPCQLFD